MNPITSAALRRSTRTTDPRYLGSCLLILLGACGGETADPSPTTASPEPASVPATARSSAEAPSSGESCRVSVACWELLGNTEQYEETRVAPTRAEACRTAADAVRESHPCGLASVDGVHVLWLANAANDPPPAAASDHELECEVGIARAVSDEVTGRGEGSTDDEARRAATAAACTAIGESECPRAGYSRSVRNRRTSLHAGAGGMTTSVEMEVALWRTAVSSGRGTSLSSRAEACANAYQAACGTDGCAARDSVFSLDGVEVQSTF